MGSRAVAIVCKDADAARRAFGITDGSAGTCYTRTGRRFFTDLELESAFLARVRAALDASGMWDELASEWVALDAELMPWSAKAQELLRQQYAPVGVAAVTSLSSVIVALDAAAERGVEIAGLPDRMRTRLVLADRYVEAYRRYAWPVGSLDDLRLAPFHVLASEGKAHVDRDHVWHMETLAKLCQTDQRLLIATPYRVVDTTDAVAVAAGVAWWEELTARGGEGMVVKPLAFVPARGAKRPVQPAMKVRGPEYLRIIYGPEYTLSENLDRLRQRGLAGKRGLAHREFALGVEGLERFVRKEPLRRVHECVFGVLALESEPVDPRL